MPTPKDTTLNTLTQRERDAGWKLLFDGHSFEGWRSVGQSQVPSGSWAIEDKAIKRVADENASGLGSDLMTKQMYRDFELAFEWKISPGGNSGVKYNVSEELSASRGSGKAALGFEYQIFGDQRHGNGRDPNHRAGALYDMIAPNAKKQLHPDSAFNQSRIILRGSHGEHWLNGEKILEYDLGTPRMDSLLAASKYAGIKGFADRRSGHIVLQDHSDEVYFRDLKIRELSPQ